jgi:two-component system response regulator PilR (NtrC family)
VTLSESGVIERRYLRLNSPLVEAALDTSTRRAALDTSADLESQLEAVERERIQAALEACHYNKTRAAKHLGITFRALRYRLAKLDMN